MKDITDRPQVIVACSDEPLRRILVHSLSTLDCGVESVATHKALVARCLSRHYAVILTCFRSPLLASCRLVARLCGTPSRRSSLFVLTDSPSASETVTLLERGVEQVMTLPVSLTRLRKKVQQSLPQCSQR